MKTFSLDVYPCEEMEDLNVYTVACMYGDTQITARVHLDQITWRVLELVDEWQGTLQ